MEISLPVSKLDKITKQWNKLLKMETTSIWDISTLLGLLEAARQVSHSPNLLQGNSILPNRGTQNDPKFQPALHPKSQSYPGNSLVDIKCPQGQIEAQF